MIDYLKKFHSLVGALIDDMAITSVLMSGNSTIESIVCVGCTGFADSIIYTSENSETLSTMSGSGWCVHTSCARVVLQATQSQPILDDSFSTYVASQCASTEKVTKLRESLSTIKYLVFAEPESSFRDSVTTHSICVVRTQKKRKTITCRDVRCKKGKSKRLDNITSAFQVCCHLQQLLTCLGFNEKDDIDFSTSSDDDAGSLIQVSDNVVDVLIISYFQMIMRRMILKSHFQNALVLMVSDLT